MEDITRDSDSGTSAADEAEEGQGQGEEADEIFWALRRRAARRRAARPLPARRLDGNPRPAAASESATPLAETCWRAPP